MISHFFIDRPIFATVLSVVITLSGALAVFTLPMAQYPPISPPQVQVAITYPGASAQVVADTVAAPIEQEVNGVPGMLYMSSISGNNGTYTLSVTFQVGTDLNTALVMVQNRVQLANPLLPLSVQNQGITIRKKTPEVLMVISVFSPDGRYDGLYLSNFATINLYDPLLRVDGVSDISILGEPQYSIRAWLDPQKLASRGMNATDVATAVANQNVAAAAGRIGQAPAGKRQAFDLPIDTLGRLTFPEQFGDIIVKVGNPGPALRAKATAPVFSAGKSLQTASAESAPVGLPGFSVNTGTAPTTGTTTNGSGGGTTNGGAATASASGGAATGGGATATGGGTTSGGGLTGGGATTGGAANGTAPAVSTSTPPTGMGIPGLSINTSTDATGVTTGGGGGIAGPLPPATAIVRLRDVARVELGALNYNET